MKRQRSGRDGEGCLEAHGDGDVPPGAGKEGGQVAEPRFFRKARGEHVITRSVEAGERRIAPSPRARHQRELVK